MISEYNKLCFQYLNEAQYYVNQYQEIDMYDAIFEAKSADVEAKIINNDKSNSSAFASLKKAAQAVIDLIKNTIESIGRGIQSLFSGKSDEANLNKIKNAMKNNPELANKKIKFFGFNNDEKEWSKIEKMAAIADKKLANGENVDISSLLSDIARYSKNIGKGAAGTIAAQTAINACYGNKEFAQMLNRACAKDGKVLSEIINVMGEKEAKRFQKEVSSLANDNKIAGLFGKRINLKREMNMARAKQCETLADSFKYTMRQFANDIATIDAAAANTSNNRDLYAAGGIKNKVRRAINKGKLAKDIAPIGMNEEIKRGYRMLKDNPDSWEGIQRGKGLANRVSNYADKKRRENHIMRKEAEYDAADYNKRALRGDYTRQPLRSFLTGGSDIKRIQRNRNPVDDEDLY